MEAGSLRHALALKAASGESTGRATFFLFRRGCTVYPNHNPNPSPNPNLVPTPKPNPNPNPDQVHGLLSEAEGGVDTYSLDFGHPLSPLVAFGAVLAAQAWQ